MDVIKREPFKELSAMRDQMDRLMGSFFRGSRPSGGSWAPDLDVSETDDAILVKAELPGVESTTEVSRQGSCIKSTGRS